MSYKINIAPENKSSLSALSNLMGGKSGGIQTIAIPSDRMNDVK